jgi:hypothetical protein
MKSYLPKEGTSLYYQILLPQFLGGLDLWLDGELSSIFPKLPVPTATVIISMHLGEDVDKDLRILKRFISNPSIRGYNFEEATREFIEGGLSLLTTSGRFEEVVRKSGLDYKSAPDIIRSLRDCGWYTLEDATQLALRGYLFRDILSGKSVTRAFNTMPWKRRYQIIWDRLYRGTPVDLPDLEEGVLKTLLKRFNPLRFYNLKEVNVMDYFSLSEGKHIHISKSVIDELEEHLPTLRIPRDLVGNLVSY